MNKLIIIIAVCLTLLSCDIKFDPSAASAINNITDSKGINIQLEWTDALGSTANGLNNVDLDMYLLLGFDTLSRSIEENSFEELQLEDHFLNLSYDLYVDYFSGKDIAFFDLFISGQSNPQEVLKIEGIVQPDSVMQLTKLVSIYKNNDTYTVSY